MNIDSKRYVMDLLNKELPDSMLDRLEGMIEHNYSELEMQLLIQLVDKLKLKVIECEELLEKNPSNPVLNHNYTILVNLGGMLKMVTKTELAA